ncbi:50S ribosomal protein L16 [Candidatus Peribacteria bacterium]|nr:50S ribosomal protein L16 [Candidatus Peribacteria bacterium]
MLQPKRVKHRKQFRLRGQAKGIAYKGNSMAYGDMALKAMTAGEITSRQIESARIAMVRTAKRGGKIWIRIFPDKVLTGKSGEMPMGKGKGAPDKWVCQVRPGTVLFEMGGVSEEIMREALRKAKYKMPCQCKIIEKNMVV